MLSAYLLNGLYAISTLALISLGLAVVLGLLGVLNMAHGEFVMLGAYCAWLVQVNDLPYLWAVPLALLVCGSWGWLVERVLIRRLYSRPFDTLVVTWGLSLLMRKCVEAVFGVGYKSVTVPLEGSAQLLGTTYPAYRLLIMAICIGMCSAVVVWYARSRTGTRIRAMVDNGPLAQSVGIPVQGLASSTFVCGVGFAGAAGVMLAPLVPVEPFMGFSFVMESFFSLVVGGLGSAAGLVAGSTIVGGTGALASALLDRTYGYVATLIVAVGFMWLKPKGLYARS